MWVKKWVDYSAKYGLGYLMSNGSYGVFFNDSSKLILHPGEQYLSAYSETLYIVTSITSRGGRQIGRTFSRVTR